MPKIIYFHGLGSGCNSGTVTYLRLKLPDVQIIAEDMPVEPEAAIAKARKMCEEHQPDIIMGTSYGGFLCFRCHGDFKKVVVNPAFSISAFIRDVLGLGKQEYFCARTDGETSYEVTQELIDDFIFYEGKLPEEITDYDKNTTWCFIGDNDQFIHDGYERFCENFDPSKVSRYPGYHQLDTRSIKKFVLPKIKDLLA
jgi:predicted esterase YcpF (UPF0227 family)